MIKNKSGIHILLIEKYMNVYLTLEGGYTSSIKEVHLRYKQERYKLLIENFDTKDKGLKYTKKLYRKDELLARVSVDTKVRPNKIRTTFNRGVELHKALEIEGLLVFRDFTNEG
jgi:hypothetical protein